MDSKTRQISGRIRYVTRGVGTRLKSRDRMMSTYDYKEHKIHHYLADEEWPQSLLVTCTRVEEILDEHGEVKKVIRTPMEATYVLTEMVEKRR
jgi:hypothetical protein